MMGIMLLSELLKDIFLNIPSQNEVEITGLTLDSRKVKPGDLFFAIHGSHHDGRLFISQAIARGAAAILKSTTKEEVIDTDNDIPIIPILKLQEKVALIAARFYGNPAEKLRIIGVTGTNGKTSCTHFIAQALTSLKIPCGIIGTLGSGFYGSLGEAGLTTPDPIALQALLADFVAQGAQAVAMEVSSHSIDQGRVLAIPFEIGIFTNLTQDHLDYHHTMEAYASVKHRFLAELPVKNVILNTDDAYGRSWLPALVQQRNVYAYGLEQLTSNVPFVTANHIELSLKGIHADIYSPWGNEQVTLPLIGCFNLHNALAVLTALCVYGIPFREALGALNQLSAVPGRMQLFGGHQQPLVVVDYAHTPDALENVLSALKSHTKGKLICVFGCGGDRDKGKRPQMARIAEKWANQVIITSDNPRHENPEMIANEMLAGCLNPKAIQVQLDRSKAIQKSIQSSSINDCILIAGKGAERYQQIGDEKFPFDDAEQVKIYLSAYQPRLFV
jgi:UDP-N-acetylmuramoyl-L-alanyl-D-glutamate--2,6-diaminopimelate ligase